MSAAEFERFLARLVPLPEPRGDATNGGRAVRNAERVREAIATAYRATPDLADITGTRWGALQAVTDVRRSRPADPRDRRPQSTRRRGSSARPSRPPLKDRALALLTEGGSQS